MKSMTGFGRAVGRLGRASNKNKDLAEVEVEVSVRTLNGRFLEVRLHSPREYMPFEAEVRKSVQGAVRRGHVDLHIHRRIGPKSNAQEITVRSEQLRSWAKAYEEAGRVLKIKWQPQLDWFLSQSDIFEVRDSTPSSAEKKLLQDLLSEALLQCDKMRSLEGKAAEKELLSLLKQMQKNLKVVQDHQLEARNELRARYEQKRAELENRDADRISQELVFWLDKMDIREEVQRLGEHLETISASVSKGQIDGKKLDFYAQELLREINTIGSKCHIRAVTDAVVDSKTLIERLREQAQNIE